MFDVLEAVRISEVTADPESYRETEHEGSAAVVELVAKVLGARGHRAGPETLHGGPRQRPDPVIGDLLAAARAAVEAGSMLALANVVVGDAGALGAGTVLREVFVRNLGYPHMVRATTHDLLSGPDIAPFVTAKCGCSVDAMFAVFDAYERAHRAAWDARMANLARLAEMARKHMGAARTIDDYDIGEDERAAGRALWDAAWDDAGDAADFDVDAIAAETRLSPETVKAVVASFSTPLRASDPADAAVAFFEARSGFRTRPILVAEDGAATAVHQGLLTPAVRERVEEVMKADPAVWDVYSKKRGEYLEDAALRLLTPHLPGAQVHHAFGYFVPDPTASPAEERPADYTKVVEGDGLILVDDVALVVEAKAGALSQLARTGDAKRLASDLRKIVTRAAEQADRLRSRILNDGGIRLRNNSWLDTSHVREAHAIAVSLDDLSGIATVTSNLVEAGLMPSTTLPWTVSLHDLQIIAELAARPAELLLYLRRRTEPDVTRKFHAVDELDFFLEFYASGLYVEPDPARVEAELPQFGDQSVSAKRGSGSSA